MKKYLFKEIVGKQVIDSKGMIIGNLKDLSFDLEAKEIALIVTTKTGVEITISSSDVGDIGDTILLNKTVEMPSPPSSTAPEVKGPTAPATSPPPSPPQVGLCSKCGYQNDPESRFCIKCGQKLLR